jgi:primosomal protein N' (replication factor Y)
VAVIHSSLGDGERFDAWQRIASGEIDLVIGTRSAVFAPLSNLGLVVMDEEHEHTYKSENDPKYHTRDVAAYRCGVHHALMLLASATPSLESYYKAERGQYTLVSLRERYGGARLPEAEIVDMRQELRAGNRSSVSRRLQELLEETVEREEQAILFLNRRGFHTSISCKSCGEPLTCPHCSIALTHHTDRVGGSSLCHCCGYRAATPRTCPSCGSDQLSFVGFGTQKAEGEIASCLPNASVLRMDADTTKGKQAHDRLLESFRRGEANVLLGTQMVTKGHDFPHVSLSGVMLADTSLYVNDFRASERTFALLTQVIGRAGRAESPGRAVIQTYTPENETIRLACLQDYESFYKSEIALRRSLSFPPFCDLVQLTISSAYEDELMTASVRLSSFMSSLAKREFSDLPLIIFGPFEAGVYKVAGKYRLRMVVKCRLCKQSRAYFSRVLIDFSKEIGHRIHVSLDMNPM